MLELAVKIEKAYCILHYFVRGGFDFEDAIAKIKVSNLLKIVLLDTEKKADEGI